MIKPPPTNHRASEFEERLVDVPAFLESGAKPAELMQQRIGLLHHVADGSQAAAMLGVPTSNPRLDPAFAELGTVRVAVVSAIRKQILQTTQGSPRLSTD